MKEQFRHELKHYINFSDYMQLRSRLPCICRIDANAGEDGRYMVRSLYFDNYSDKAVTEKLAGVSRREKFRLRYYNDDTSYIRLEKKSKIKRLCSKRAEGISANLCKALLNGDYGVLLEGGSDLMAELYAKMRYQNLRPKTIIEYMREAYVFNAGNVRVTIDTDIRMSGNVFDFLDTGRIGIPCARAMILEVKYDDFLPDVIKDMVQLGTRADTEFSKYLVARLV